MSLLPYALFTSIGPTSNVTDPAISQNLFSSNATISSITTNRIALDGNNLDTTGTGGSATLLLNGIAIASASGLTSTIANWGYYPALSTINYDSNGGTINMINGRFSNVSTATATVSSITVSTINGQTVGGLGQSILYRPPTILSSQTVNVSFPNRLITAFANPLSGKTVQGVWNGDFAGAVAVSNSGGYPPQMGVFISDNNVSPYTPTNALGGVFEETFFPIGENNIGSFTGNMSNSVNVPFAFSNSPSSLYVIWAEQNPGGSTPSFAINNVSSSFLCVVGGGTPQLV
jgi:hypothetical protein